MWLDTNSGGAAAIKQRLVFAHNDVSKGLLEQETAQVSLPGQTQYGNVLRLEPSGESPLLLPINEHKQLVVIDFEYAGANTGGLEFANHFVSPMHPIHASGIF
jgi:choline kinase